MSFKARSILGTFFYEKEDPEEWLRGLHKTCDYVVGQCEKCPETGRCHLQFFAHAKSQVRWPYPKQFKAHIEAAKIPEDARNYCMKEETRFDGPWEFGTFKKNGRPKNKDLIQGNLEQMVLEDKITLLQYPKLKQAKEIFLCNNRVSGATIVVPEVRKRIGCWVWGKPRTGKSTMARKNDPYIKMPNKWWDGYIGQEEVLLEDVEPSMKSWLGYFIKIWSDWWQFRCEIKGGSVLIGPFKKFWITSNYSPEEVFGTEDQMLIDALYERFEIINL